MFGLSRLELFDVLIFTTCVMSIYRHNELRMDDADKMAAGWLWRKIARKTFACTMDLMRRTGWLMEEPRT